MSVKNKKSGGVKTEEGKLVTRYNAQKHSILRDSATEYEQVDLANLYNDLVDELKPIGRAQEACVEIIALNIIKLTRLAKSEAELIKQQLSPYHKAEGSIEVFKPAHYEYEPELQCIGDRYALFSRYQTATENRLYRAMAMLKRLQGYE